MTESEIKAYVDRLELRGGYDELAVDGTKAFAHYAEIPGCLALGVDMASAVKELQTLIVPFIRLIADAGGELPIPLRDASHTSYVTISGLVIGDLLGDSAPQGSTGADMLGATVTETREVEMAA